MYRPYMLDCHPVHYITLRLLRLFSKYFIFSNLQNQKILGLDCEWVSVKSLRNPVALLQLAAPNGFCSLFRLCSMEYIPTELKVSINSIDISYVLANK